MSTFLQAMDLPVWMSIQQDWKTPTTPEAQWNETIKKAYIANYKALNIIFCTVSHNEFRWICSLTSAKEA